MMNLLIRVRLLLLPVRFRVVTRVEMGNNGMQEMSDKLTGRKHFVPEVKRLGI